MSEWREIEIGEVADLINGFAFKSTDFLSKKISDSVFPILKIKNVANGDANFNDVVYHQYSDKLKNYIISKNDILIALTGNHPFAITQVVGGVSRYKHDEKALLNQRVGKIISRDKLKLNNDYLYYFFKWNNTQSFLGNQSSGSASQANISKNDVLSCPVLLPDIEEQKEIAKTLSNLDKKITLLRQQNQDLEELAQTLFKRWFVEFEFPNENGAPYKSSGGLMIESELGEIPEGWRVTQLKELCNKISKGTTPIKNEVDGCNLDIPFIKVKDITDEGQIKYRDIENIPQLVHYGSLKRSILIYNDVLFSIAGTIGRVTILPYELNNSNCNQAVAFIRLKEKEKHLELIHQWLKSNSTQNEITSSIVQGVQANVSLGVLGNLIIRLPNDLFLKKWKYVIEPIYSKGLNCIIEIQTLTQLRDTLLPKLMSGEIRLNSDL